jgi:hypothetical protein
MNLLASASTTNMNEVVSVPISLFSAIQLLGDRSIDRPTAGAGDQEHQSSTFSLAQNIPIFNRQPGTNSAPQYNSSS